jgi:hypothetical protein
MTRSSSTDSRSQMKHYAHRNLANLEPHYSEHVSAMTAEGLHDKAAIAAELAFRDAEIERLKHQMSRMVFDDRELGWG